MISSSVQLAMWVSVAVLAALPIVVFLVCARKAELNLSAAIMGVIVYFLFETLLYGMIFNDLIFINLSPGLRDLLFNSPAGYTAFSSITRAIFYVAGFYVATRFTMKTDVRGNGLAIASGFVTGRMLLDGAWPLFQNIRSVWAINTEGAEAYLAQAAAENAEPEQLERLRTSVELLLDSKAGEFMFAVVEMTLLCVVLFAVCYVVHLATTRRAPFWLVYAAMPVLAVALVAPSLLNIGALERVTADLLTLAGAVAVGVLAVVCGKRYMSNELKW